MEVLTSRVSLRPADFERSFRFYAEALGLHVYREWKSGSMQGLLSGRRLPRAWRLLGGSEQREG